MTMMDAAPAAMQPENNDRAAITGLSAAMAKWNALPAWLRWGLSAAIGVLVLATVQTVTGDTDRLTASSASESMLRWSIPVLLAGLGGLFSERAGVVNIGLEGMMILGTWFGAWGAFNWGPWGGIMAGLIGGALGGLLHAVATVSFGVDHIVSGVAINILAPGIARYLSDQVFTGYTGGSITQSPRVESAGLLTMPFLAGGKIGEWKSPDWLGDIAAWDIFFLSDMAGFTRGLFSALSYFSIIALAMVPLSAWVLWRTRFGLRLRVCGEEPSAGESLGVNIYAYKYAGVIISGALAGLAGAFIVIELTSIYREGQTNGRGFIGLAALIFGNWRPSGILVGALLFAYPEALSLRDLDGTASSALRLVIVIGLMAVLARSVMNARRADAVIAGVLAAGMTLWYVTASTVPDWFPDILPFALVLLVLLFNSQRLRMPKADGLPYRRGS